MNKSLTTLAKEIVLSKKTSVITPEEMELALAWARGEVRIVQASKVYAENHSIKHGMGVYSMFARALKQYIQENKL